MHTTRLTLFAVCFFAVTNVATARVSSAQRLSGTWDCRPYTLRGNGTMTVTERSTYNSDGSYTSGASYIQNFPSGATTSAKLELRGTWNIKGNLLRTRLNAVTFLESSNPKYTVSMGQKDADKALKQRPSETDRIVQFGPPLILKSLSARNRKANISVTCSPSGH